MSSITAQLQKISIRGFVVPIGLGVFIGFSALPILLHAAPFENVQTQFVPLAGIPFMNEGAYTIPQLINATYRIAIVLGALIAVLKITLAGIKYMGTDHIGSKSEAKEDIKNALLGLLILLAAVLILRQIIGEIKLDVLQLNSVGQQGGGQSATPSQNPTPTNLPGTTGGQ